MEPKNKLLHRLILERFPSALTPQSYDSTLKIIGDHDPATIKQIGAIHNCFNYINKYVYNNTLGEVFFTMNKKAHSHGYYKPNAWGDDSTKKLAEINIDPTTLKQGLLESMKVLVVLMGCHFQHLYGMPGSQGYFNIEFSSLMNAVGLSSGNKERPGGKSTGRQVSYQVIPDGPFDQAFKHMPVELKIPFKPIGEEPSDVAINRSSNKREKGESKRGKTKYTCLGCSRCFWGKPNMLWICGVCHQFAVVIADFGKQKKY